MCFMAVHRDVKRFFSSNEVVFTAVNGGPVGNGLEVVFGEVYSLEGGATADRIHSDFETLEIDGAGDLIETDDFVDNETGEIIEDTLEAIHQMVVEVLKETTDPSEDWIEARNQRRRLKDGLAEILSLIPSSAQREKDDREKVSDHIKHRFRKKRHSRGRGH